MVFFWSFRTLTKKDTPSPHLCSSRLLYFPFHFAGVLCYLSLVSLHSFVFFLFILSFYILTPGFKCMISNS